jgi:hypothetical protein
MINKYLNIKTMRILFLAFCITAVLMSCEEQEPFNATLPVQIQPMNHPDLDADENRNLSVHLDGNQEKPNPVDTKAQGQAKFQLSKDGTSLNYKLIVANIENVFMAHLHRITDPAASTGGVVVWLYPSSPPSQLIPGKTNGVLAEGEITAANLTGSLAGMELEDLIDAINDGTIYVNVHTTQNGPGEIRGDIKGTHEPS